MNNKTKGVIAGIAGLALLGGGTTFALWSDMADLDGATITNGDLSVEADGSMSWQDVSGAAPVDITTIGDFRMVPGDIVEGTQDFDVTLEGDNLVALLSVDRAAGAEPLPTHVTAGFKVLDSEGDEVGSADFGGSVELVPDDEDATIQYSVVVTVAFDEAAGGRTSATETVDLEGVVVSLTQDR